MDEPSCDVAPKVGAAVFAGIETRVVDPNTLIVGALGTTNGESIKEEPPKADVWQLKQSSLSCLLVHLQMSLTTAMEASTMRSSF